jgi:membrane protein YdbS with pleckstrin-like domain
MTQINPEPADPTHLPHDISAPREAEPEKIYYEGSPLVRGNLSSLFLLFVIGALFVAAPFIWRFTGHEWFSWWAVLACIVIGVLFFVGPMVWSRTIRYRISNYRIDFERGLLSKSIDTMELWHVDDIKFHQSLLERILGVGTITIFATDQTTPDLPLRGLPKPREIFDALKARVIAIKRTRGVIKMDAGVHHHT